MCQITLKRITFSWDTHAISFEIEKPLCVFQQNSTLGPLGILHFYGRWSAAEPGHDVGRAEVWCNTSWPEIGDCLSQVTTIILQACCAVITYESVKVWASLPSQQHINSTSFVISEWWDNITLILKWKFVTKWLRVPWLVSNPSVFMIARCTGNNHSQIR